MKDKKKLLAIIGGVVVVAVVILCICLIPGNKENPSDVDVNNEKTLQEEFEELKDKVKDIYDVEPTPSFVYDDGSQKHVVKDVVHLYEYFPSKDVQNKNTEGSVLEEEIMEIANNIDDFNKLKLGEDAKPIISDGGVEYPYQWINFVPNLEGYNYKEKEGYATSNYLFNMYSNAKNIALVEQNFGSKAEFYQACYDVLIEYINMVPEEDLKKSFAPLVSYYTFDTVYEAIEEGDYSVLFDGIMNHRIAFVYIDEEGVFYRLEKSTWDYDMDGTEDDTLNVTIKYSFDDESKYN
jgi:hypothetical protein